MPIGPAPQFSQAHRLDLVYVIYKIFERNVIHPTQPIDSNSFLGPMVRIPPFQGGGSCSIHGGCISTFCDLFSLFALSPSRLLAIELSFCWLSGFWCDNIKILPRSLSPGHTTLLLQTPDKATYNTNDRILRKLSGFGVPIWLFEIWRMFLIIVWDPDNTVSCGDWGTIYVPECRAQNLSVRAAATAHHDKTMHALVIK